MRALMSRPRLRAMLHALGAAAAAASNLRCALDRCAAGPTLLQAPRLSPRARSPAALAASAAAHGLPTALPGVPASRWRHALPIACVVEDAEVDPDEWITEDGGVRKAVLRAALPNASHPAWGALVQIKYTCSFDNGTVFDETHRDVPFEFQLNAGTVVDGLQRGVETMSVGERALFRCEPRWAYGSASIGDIVPTESTLRYAVELLSWEKGPEIDNEELDMETYRSALEGREVASGSCPLYNWSEGGEELTLNIALPSGQGARDVICEFTTRALRVEVARGGPVIEGELRARILPDESYWLIDEDGEVPALQVVVAKKAAFQRWNGVFQSD